MFGPSNLNPDGSIYLKATPTGEPLIVGNSYFFKGQFWNYAGDFKRSIDVPDSARPCCYTVGDEIRIAQVEKVFVMPREKIKRKRADDDRPINTEITDEDNLLMAMMKSALRQKEVTRGDFKQLYENDSDMNNSLRAIEQGGNLSWGRFQDLTSRMKINYDLQLYDKDGTAISQDKPKPVKKKKK